jgi:hypothetical protein
MTRTPSRSFEAGQVFRVESRHAGLDAGRKNQGIPERRASYQMKVLGAPQNAVGGQYQRHEVFKLGEAIPRVSGS